MRIWVLLQELECSSPSISSGSESQARFLGPVAWINPRCWNCLRLSWIASALIPMTSCSSCHTIFNFLTVYQQLMWKVVFIWWKHVIHSQLLFSLDRQLESRNYNNIKQCNSLVFTNSSYLLLSYYYILWIFSSLFTTFIFCRQQGKETSYKEVKVYGSLMIFHRKVMKFFK